MIDPPAGLLRRAAALSVGLALASGAVTRPAAAATLTRYPWISLRSETSALIAWQTDVAAAGKVLYGPTPALGNEAAHAGSVTNHSVTLAGLDPGAACYYRIVSGPDTLTAGADWFRTAPAAEEPFRFLAFGDLGRASAEQIAVASRVDSLGADLAILTGDIIYEAGEAVNFTPQYFTIYRPTIARIPFYPCLGNHDVGTAGGQPYLDAFYLPANNPAATERYYSFDYSNAHFVSIEVTVENTAPNAAMLAWLDADLAATTKHWKFVFFHVPMYSNLGTHGDDPTIRAALEPIFNQRGVDIVFQGHNHYYTRTFPLAGGSVTDQAQEPQYVNPGGTIYIVTGGGGRSLYALSPLQAYEAYSKSTYHTTVVDVAGTSLTLRAVERNGAIPDTMTLIKDALTAVTVVRFEAVADAQGVLLRWSPGSDAGLAGFHVYRAGSVSDPGVRLTGEMLLRGGPDFEYLDRTAVPGETYYYSLGAVDDQGAETRIGMVRGTAGGPYRFALGPARPNPFAHAASFTLTLDRRGPVRVEIFDLRGARIRTLRREWLGAGPHRITWDGRDDGGRPAASGIYVAVAASGARLDRSKLVLMRGTAAP